MLIVAAVAVSSFRRPAAAVSLLVIMYALEQWAQSKSTFFIAHRAAGNLIVAAALPIAVVAAIKSRGLREVFVLPTTQWLSLALFLFALASWFWTPVPREMLHLWRLSGPFLLLSVLIGPLVVSRPADLVTAVRWILLVGTPVAVLLLFTSDWGDRGIAVAGMGTHDRANPLVVGELGGVLAIAAALNQVRSGRWLFVVVRWSVFLLGLTLAFKSESRGQVLAAIAAALLFLPLAREFTSIKGFVTSIFALVAAGVVVLTLWGYLATSSRWDLSEMNQAYEGGRLLPVKTVLSYWLDAGPVAWFIGLGNSASYHPTIWGFYPHFVPAEILAELGFVGMGVYLAILVVTTQSAVRGMLASRTDPAFRGAISCFAALTFYSFLISLKQGSLIGSPFFFLFAICLARGVMFANGRWWSV